METPGRRWKVLLGAVIPALPLAALVWLNQVPTSVQQDAVPLAGPWKLLDSSEEKLENLSVEDAKWAEVLLPGNLYMAGHTGQHHWLRKTFEWRAVPQPEERFFLMAGNVRFGTLELFVNGEYVGRDSQLLYDRQPDFSHVAGWEVPGRLIHQGKNTISLRVFWHYTLSGGFFDQRMLFGHAAPLQPFSYRMAALGGFVASGSVFLCALLAVLLVVLIRATSAEEASRRLKFALLLVIGTGQAVTLIVAIPALAGVWPDNENLIDVWTTGTWGAAIILFAEHWALGRVTIFGKLYVFLAIGVCVPVSFFYPEVIQAQAVLSLLVLCGVAVLSIWRLARERAPAVSLTAFALLFWTASAISDVAGTLGLSSFPALTPLSATVLALIVSVTLIAEFVQISQRSEVLSASLAVTNSDLTQALVRAQESTRVKSQLLAAVSHELRTPLNAIVNVPEGLLEDFESQLTATCSACQSKFELESGAAPVNEHSKCPTCQRAGTLSATAERRYRGDAEHTTHYLDVIRRSGKHLLSVVNDLLDYSKLNASAFSISPAPIALAPMLEEVFLTAEPIATSRGLSLEFSRMLPDRRLFADSTRLRQVLLNLLSNAVKFSKENGKVTLQVYEDGAECVFEVSDQGIGIAQENQKLIFESFRQIEGGNTRRFAGTGLGLSIAKELVALHGGSISVRSQVNEGTTFVVRLPFEGPRANLLSAPKEAQAGATVLIIEDDPLGIETIKLALEPLGCSLVSQTDPRTALGLIKELKPRAVVLDVLMAPITGLEVLKQIRDDPSVAGTRVVVTSAYLENADAARALGAEWIAKPWHGTQLADAVNTCLAAPRPFLP